MFSRSSAEILRLKILRAARYLIIASGVFIGGKLAVGDELLPVAKSAARARWEIAISDSVFYLVNAQLPNGEFIYARHLDPRRKYPYQNNLLRHCGAVYALAQAQDFCRVNPQINADLPAVAAAISRANVYLKKFIAAAPPNLTAQFPADNDALAVWSPEELLSENAPMGSPVVAKLGASALGILALLAEKDAGKNLALAQRLGKFLLRQQRADGSFISRITAGASREDAFDSRYYPGEAVLALLTLYERDADSRWLNAAIRATKFLATSRAQTGEYPPDHWILIASAKLSPVLPPLAILTREELNYHAAKICEQILTLASRWPLAGESGALRRGGFTTPTATMCEGLFAAREFLLENSQAELRAKIWRVAENALAFLLTAQITFGELRGAMPRNFSFDRLRQKSTMEISRAGEVRIDYVQHALSAMIKYYQEKFVGNASAGGLTPK